jgi:hypothetical protein
MSDRKKRALPLMGWNIPGAKMGKMGFGRGGGISGSSRVRVAVSRAWNRSPHWPLRIKDSRHLWLSERCFKPAHSRRCRWKMLQTGEVLPKFELALIPVLTICKKRIEH